MAYTIKCLGYQWAPPLLVSLAAVFWMSRNIPHIQVMARMLRDIKRLFIVTRETVSSFTLDNFLCLYKCFFDDIFALWDGPKKNLLEFIGAIYTWDECLKITVKINYYQILFLQMLLFKDFVHNMLQYSTFQKPLNT